MALCIPYSIFYLARLLYVRPETFGPYYVIEDYTFLRIRNFEDSQSIKMTRITLNELFSVGRSHRLTITALLYHLLLK